MSARDCRDCLVGHGPRLAIQEPTQILAQLLEVAGRVVKIQGGLIGILLVTWSLNSGRMTFLEGLSKPSDSCFHAGQFLDQLSSESGKGRQSAPCIPEGFHRSPRCERTPSPYNRQYSLESDFRSRNRYSMR
jgi:hypothetical protein